MLKFLIKAAASGVVVYAVCETLNKLKVADRVTNLASDVLDKVADLVPTGFEPKAADKPYEPTDLR